jgi:hypothetical protein
LLFYRVPIWGVFSEGSSGSRLTKRFGGRTILF